MSRYVGESPRRQRRGVVAAALGAALALAGGGCENVYRLNHLHSDANQKAADEAFTSFEAFTSQTAGLEPQLLRNVEARRQLEGAVGSLRARVNDTEFAVLTTDMTWERLQLERYVQLGLLQRAEDANGQPLAVPEPLNLNFPGDLAYARTVAAVGGYDQLLAERISTRVYKVTAIARLLELVADAHALLAEETAKKYKQTLDELDELRGAPAAAAAPEGDDPAGSARVEWVRALFQSVIDARKSYLEVPEVLRTANDLQRKLLADIEASRDPVEASALVAIVGTGLSDFDFAILDAYVLDLDARLDDLEARLTVTDAEITRRATATGGTSSQSLGAAWTDLKRSLTNARVWVRYAVWLIRAEKDPDGLFAGPGPRHAPTDPDRRAPRARAVQLSLRPNPRDFSRAQLVDTARGRVLELLDRYGPAAARPSARPYPGPGPRRPR